MFDDLTSFIIRRYMLDESEDESNIFTLSVGNVPSQCDVVIKITYPSISCSTTTGVDLILPALL